MELFTASVYSAGMSRSLMIAIAFVSATAMLLATPLVAIADTGLPLPRFASLRANKVHLRTGPGVRYPVDWIFVQLNMPIEIVAEFENWRKVRDWQGTEGWVHRSMLSGKRTAVIKGGIQPLRREPASSAALTARVMEKVVARILECEGEWCRVEIGKKRGWMRRTHIWGVHRNEQLN
jgi:SH3-like domain-containing protein